MALISPSVNGSQVRPEHIALNAFLHTRVRQWKESEHAMDSTECIALPDGFHFQEDIQIEEMHPKNILWSETFSGSDNEAHSDATLTSYTPGTPNQHTALEDPICPTFSGGSCPRGGNLFADRSVQRAILTFFEDIARSPTPYHNCGFKLKIDVIKASPNGPLDLSANNIIDREDQTLPAEMILDQGEIIAAQEELDEMCAALNACPLHIAELRGGMDRLSLKIEKKVKGIEEMKVKALGNGALPVGQAQDERRNWKQQKEGTKVPFAGTMVDSELLKAAGFLETADAELSKADEGGNANEDA